MTATGLPDFPWDSLAALKQRASAHAGGLVDLSVGTPVDATPEVVRRALADASNAPGYPQVWGTPDLRQAVVDWFERRRGVPGLDPDGVLPTIGSKELVAWLPTQLGLGKGDTVVHPEVAYPTYDVGARLAGASPRPMRSLTGLGPMTRASAPGLLWLNTPSNPTGQVLGLGHLRKVVSWARLHGVLVASDECYAELDWREDPGEDDSGRAAVSTPSLLDPRVCGGDPTGLLVVYSLSKRSSMAGYRAGFVAGDVSVVRRLLEIRRHAGMMLPWPVQRAMVAALGDDEHVAVQKARYARRRTTLTKALATSGFRVDHSDAGLYLWSSRGEGSWETLEWLAGHGILAAPGTFYGPAGAEHVRIALTASDERIEAAAQRLA
jgi:succinyldiaminopimelate transaminase